MRLFIYCFVFLFLLQTNAYAQDYPTTGLLYGTKETDSIVHFCNELDDGTLECQFTQTKVRKKSKKLSYKEMSSKAEKEFDYVKKSILEGKTCDAFGLVIKVLEGDISIEKAADLFGDAFRPFGSCEDAAHLLDNYTFQQWRR